MSAKAGRPRTAPAKSQPYRLALELAWRNLIYALRQFLPLNLRQLTKPMSQPITPLDSTAPAQAPSATETPTIPAQNGAPNEGANEGSNDALLAALRDEISQLKAQNTDLAEQFLRAKAEAENTRRRAEEDMSKARKFAIESFAHSLLPVADSLEAGLGIQEATAEQLRQGSEATLKQLQSALERHKVQHITPAVAEKFDPHHHQAISMVAADQEANTIVSVLQKGYLIADRILRPALVTVAQPK